MPGSVTVITPTTGAPELVDALISVADQDYEGELVHLLVVDGVQFLDKVNEAVKASGKSPRVLVLPENTGSDGWNGHRIHASIPVLVNTDYVSFLDEDNWFMPNHISSLVKVIERDSVPVSFSLRGIYSKSGEYLCNDDCESLGLWPVWDMPDGNYLIDTSCYLFKTEFLQETCSIWRRKLIADRAYAHYLHSALGGRFSTTGLYTLGYRLGNTEISVAHEYFKKGNYEQQKKYFESYPWFDLRLTD
jgi:hypothetical protein